MREAVRALERYQPLWGFWRVEELIGQTGGCEVYKAYKEEWGKRYTSTIKFVSFSVAKSDIEEAQAIGIDAASMPDYFKSMIGSILNEIELMYKLRGSSNIVIYEDHAIYPQKGGLGWDVLIRMEYLQPLPEFMIGRRLGRSEVARLGIDICKALEACGREGIIHRDIKDSSIFVSDKGEFKLGSFSLAKELLKGRRIALAQFNPLYMAPELYKEQSYDFSVDIYSLGIVMYKLLNRGRLPFFPLDPESIAAEDTERSIAGRMAGEELALPVDAGENLGAIILKACSYEKKDRYKSPYEFRQKLERFLKADRKAAKEDSLGINSTFDCTADKAGTIYAEESERAAVAELAASIDKENNEDKLTKKRLIISFFLGLSIMALAFTLAYIKAYDEKPPVFEAAAEITLLTPSPIITSTTASTTASTPAPQPGMAKSGEDYFNEGLECMKNKQYGSAVSAFIEAKKLGYDNSKAERQIRTARKHLEVQKLHKKAAAYYDQQDYERAIAAFAELAKNNADYSNSAQYIDSFYQLAGKYNLLGMQYFKEGKLEQSVKEFDAALKALDRMKESQKEYDSARYLKWYSIYEGNKNSLLEKIQKIEENLRLAAECNKAGVKNYSEGSLASAKQEFEKAVKYLKDIRLLVPNYSSNGYEGLLQIYEENLISIEKKQ